MCVNENKDKKELLEKTVIGIHRMREQRKLPDKSVLLCELNGQNLSSRQGIIYISRALGADCVVKQA